MASVRSLDAAFGYDTTSSGPGSAQIPVMGNTLRNLIEGSDLVMSHILHFYHLTALDYINTNTSILNGVAPWGNGKDNTSDMVTSGTANYLIGNYVQGLNIRRKAHEMAAYIDGKHPCQPVLLPGGVTKVVDANLKTNLGRLLGNDALSGTYAISQANSGNNIRSFIKYCYIPDVVTVAKAFSGSLLIGSAGDGVGAGCKRYLAYGTFPDAAGTNFISGGFLDWTGSPSVSTLNTALITESVAYSRYDAACEGKHPSEGMTLPSPSKAGAYSWLKAPMYNGLVAEVGPLARVLVNYAAGVAPWVSTVDSFLNTIGLASGIGGNVPDLRSVLGRHAARALECDAVAEQMLGWINSLTTTATTGETYRHRDIPRTATGYGLTEAPRGALGHWITINGKKIANYQCVVPTTWNARPRDINGHMGPIENALSGINIGSTAETTAMSARIKVGRIVRSFDPCIACAVHIVSPDKEEVLKFELPTQ